MYAFLFVMLFGIPMLGLMLLATYSESDIELRGRAAKGNQEPLPMLERLDGELYSGCPLCGCDELPLNSHGHLQCVDCGCAHVTLPTDKASDPYRNWQNAATSFEERLAGAFEYRLAQSMEKNEQRKYLDTSHVKG